MTLRTQYTRLISLLEATTPGDTRIGADKFKHVPEGADGKALTSRCFWLESSVDGESMFSLPYLPDLSGSPRVDRPITLSIHYRDLPARRSLLDEAIEADALAIAKTLLAPTAPGTRSTTGIDFIKDLKWRRERVGEHWINRMRFLMRGT
jgi:hypothetical protein